MSDMLTPPPVRRALLSVSDKSGIVELAQALAEHNIEILSTGGTAKALRDAWLPVKEVSDHTGFPEIMGGRVKTLHPKVHGGILGRRATDEAAMAEHQIGPIDLVVVNLYPFRETIAKPDVTFEDAIENIDIGGPAMVRAAAKNHTDVIIAVDPNDYGDIVNALNNPNTITADWRREMAAKAYAHTASYDSAIANWMTGAARQQEFPEALNLNFKRRDTLRYGENPHQQAAFYTDETPVAGTIAGARSIQGKALSYNNIADADAALQAVQAFAQPACVIVKHANPCGIALHEDLTQAYQHAFAVDSTSAFGGIIAFNQPVGLDTVQTILDQQFVEVLIAPEFAPEAIAAVQKKPNIRVLESGILQGELPGWHFQRIGGGLLVQDRDHGNLVRAKFDVVSKRAPSAAEEQDLKFAWQAVKYVKSNAIVYAKNQVTIGIGAGQMSRVVSARIAGMKAEDAGLEVPGSVMASDAFFPFRDGIDAAAEAGIKAVIQPGGSIRDEEVIAAADEHDIAMVFTGMRHFRH